MIDRIKNPPPGMLRRGSPTIYSEAIPATVLRIQEIRPSIIGASIALDNSPMLPDRCTDAEFRDLALDLTDPTGRAHLAAWIDRQRERNPFPIGVSETRVMLSAAHFWDMTVAETDLLARVGFAAMGRTA